MKKSSLLRSWYEGKRFFVSAAVNNALEARLAEAAGYDTVTVSGSGTAAMCGLPDAGLTTMTEVVSNTRYIVNAVSIPVTVDGDTGFGNIHKVRRTVQEVIQTGAAGMFFEDKAELRRGGFIAGKRVLPIDEAIAKYRAAADIRNEFDRDFILTARCTCGALGGSLAEAIARGKAYRDAGMDVIYYDSLQSIDEIRECIAEVGPPIYFALGAIPLEERPSHEEMARMGISSCAGYWILRPLRNYPSDRLMWEILHDTRKRGPKALLEWNNWAKSFHWKYPEPPHFQDFMGFDKVREVEERYLRPEEQEK